MINREKELIATLSFIFRQNFEMNLALASVRPQKVADKDVRDLVYLQTINQFCKGISLERETYKNLIETITKEVKNG